MASVKKDPTRTKTPWVCRWRDEAGTLRKKGFARKVDADRFRAEVEHKLNTGTYMDPKAGRVAFQEYAERWRNAQPHRFNTAKRVKSQFTRHVYPKIGARPLGQIRTSEVQSLVTGLPLGASSVRPVYSAIRAVFRSAVRDRLISYDPTDGVKLPEAPRDQVVPLTVDQVDALAAAVPPRYQALIEVDAGTGLRQGELFGFEVSDVDFLRKTLRVERQIQLADGGGVVVCPLKNKDSYRTVPLGDVVVERLAAHLADFPPVEVAVLDTTGPKPVTRMALFVFTDDDGQPLHRNRFNETVWNPAREAIGLPEIGCHDLRHFYASALIRAGLGPKVVAARLGHADASLTLRIYVHLWPDDEDRSRQAIDEIFRRDVPKVRPRKEA